VEEVHAEEGVDRNWIPIDINAEIRTEMSRLGPAPNLKRVSFNNTPMIINPDVNTHEYDIIQDIKDQKANVTIGHSDSSYMTMRCTKS